MCGDRTLVGVEYGLSAKEVAKLVCVDGVRVVECGHSQKAKQ